MRSPLRNTSRGNISSRRTMASPRPRSTTTLPYSTRLTMPLTMSPMRSLYSSYCRSRSASRTFCTITCFADCEAMRPYSSGGMPPARLFEADLGGGVFNRVDHQHVAREMKLAALRVDLRADFGLAAVSRARRFGDGVFHRAQNDLTVDRLFASDCVRDLQQFKSIGANGRHRQSPCVDSVCSCAAIPK